MRSWDSGKTWQWSCAEVYAGSSSQAEYRPMLITSNGRILVSAGFDGLRISDDACQWRKSTSFGSALLSDVSLWGTDVIALTSTSADTGFDTFIWKSTDQGDTWTKAGTPMPSNFIGSAVRPAPSDAKRLYVVGIAPNGTVGVVQRSSDGGSTWTAHEFPFDQVTQLGAFFRLPLVHPTRPDVAFIRIDSPEGFGEDAPDTIMGTKDGGVTWTKVFASTGDLPGIAVSPDGKTLLIAGPVDGVQSADVDDALTRGPGAFEQVFSGMVWGLNWVDDGSANGLLYAGNNNFGAVGVPEITLGTSRDGGHTFELAMNICQISYSDSCASASTLDQQCKDLWNTPPTGFGFDFVYGDRCVTKDAGADGGNNAAGAKSESCACSAPGRGDTGVPAATALAALAVVAGRFRRKRLRSS